MYEYERQLRRRRDLASGGDEILREIGKNRFAKRNNFFSSFSKAEHDFIIIIIFLGETVNSFDFGKPFFVYWSHFGFFFDVKNYQFLNTH